LNGQVDWPTANGAVLDQGLLALGSVDLQWKHFAAMRTRDFRFDD
jgi:hypothetical protein